MFLRIRSLNTYISLVIKSQENKFFLDEQVIWFIEGVQRKSTTLQLCSPIQNHNTYGQIAVQKVKMTHVEPALGACRVWFVQIQD